MNAEAIAERKLPEPGTQEWLNWRRSGIGGSEAAACVGMHHYMTLVDMVMRKRGQSEFTGNEATERGKALEPGIRRAIELMDGCTVTGEVSMVHQELSWMKATLDGFKITDNETRPVQIKTHAAYPEIAAQYGPSGSDQFPDHERVQVVHEMAVADVEREDLVVLLADNEAMKVLAHMATSGVDVDVIARYINNLGLRRYTIERDREIEQELIDAERDVWERYIAGDETPTDITKADPKGKPREATPKEETMVQALKQSWLERKRAEISVDMITDQIKDQIGEDAGIKTSVGTVTWKKNKDTVRDVTDWEGIAVRCFESMDQEKIDALLAEFTETKTKEGSRVFRVPTGWKKDL